MKVEIYSDIACPWCYIGERRFARALAAFPGASEVEVVFRPYQLDPAAPDEPVAMPQYLAKRFGRPADGMFARVAEAGAADGLTMNFDRALAVNTRSAHRLSRLALRECGPAVQRGLMDRLFASYFTDGGNVADHTHLTRLAVAAGMDEARVVSYLASNEGEAELTAEFDAAREQGVKAVPTFVIDGRYALEGAQPASALLQALEEVQRLASAASRRDANDTDVDGCDDGQCAVSGGIA